MSPLVSQARFARRSASLFPQMPECPGTQWISVAMPWARRACAFWWIHLDNRCPGPGSRWDVRRIAASESLHTATFFTPFSCCLSDIDWHWPDKSEFTDYLEDRGKKWRDTLGHETDAKFNDEDDRTMQRFISCLQRRVTWRDTTTPKKPPSSPARKLKTTMSATTKPKTALSPMPKITSHPSLDHVLVSSTSRINTCTSDVHGGVTIPKDSKLTTSGSRRYPVAWGESNIPSHITQSAVSCTILSPTVLTGLGYA